MGSNRGYPDKKRTSEQAQKRWESLRTMSRQHKKYHEQGRSGSGASQDSQEFQYCGEMSFLVRHYTPRHEFQPIVINIPSGQSRTEECDTNSNTDMYESMSSDDSCFLSLPVLSPPRQLANEIHSSDTDDCVPFILIQQKTY